MPGVDEHDVIVLSDSEDEEEQKPARSDAPNMRIPAVASGQDGVVDLASVIGSGLCVFATDPTDSGANRQQWRSLAQHLAHTTPTTLKARPMDIFYNALLSAGRTDTHSGRASAPQKTSRRSSRSGSKREAGGARAPPVAPRAPLLLSSAMLRDRWFRHPSDVRAAPGAPPHPDSQVREAAKGALVELFASSMAFDGGIGLPFHPGVFGDPRLYLLGFPEEEPELGRWTRLLGPQSKCTVVAPHAVVSAEPGTSTARRERWAHAMAPRLGTLGFGPMPPIPHPAETVFVPVSHLHSVNGEDRESLQHAKLVIARFPPLPPSRTPALTSASASAGTSASATNGGTGNLDPRQGGFLRVIVTSANLCRHCWDEMHQCVWVQDFFRGHKAVAGATSSATKDVGPSAKHAALATGGTLDACLGKVGTSAKRAAVAPGRHLAAQSLPCRRLGASPSRARRHQPRRQPVSALMGDFGRQLRLLAASWGADGTALAAVTRICSQFDLSQARADLVTSSPRDVQPRLKGEAAEDLLRDGRGWDRLALCRAQHIHWLRLRHDQPPVARAVTAVASVAPARSRSAFAAAATLSHDDDDGDDDDGEAGDEGKASAEAPDAAIAAAGWNQNNVAGRNKTPLPPSLPIVAAPTVQVVTSSMGGLTGGVLRRVVQAVRGIPGSTERDKQLLPPKGPKSMATLRKQACAQLLAPGEAARAVRVAWPSRSQAMSHERGAGKMCFARASLMGKETGTHLTILTRLRRLRCGATGASGAAETSGRAKSRERQYRNSHAKMLHPLLRDQLATVAAAAATAGCPPECLQVSATAAAAPTAALTGFSGPGGVVDDWLYAGSANFSQAAWGVPGRQLRCNNWEVGVVLPPSAARARMAATNLTASQQRLLLAVWMHSARQTGHPSLAGATLCDTSHNESYRTQRSTQGDDPWTSPE